MELSKYFRTRVCTGITINAAHLYALIYSEAKHKLGAKQKVEVVAGDVATLVNERVDVAFCKPTRNTIENQQT